MWQGDRGRGRGRVLVWQNAEAVRSGAPGTGSAIAVMSSDFESYEQDFAVLTAEITGRIGKVPKLVGGERLLSAPAALAPQARVREPRRLPAVGAQGGGGRCRRGSVSSHRCHSSLLTQRCHHPAPRLSQQRDLSRDVLRIL